MKLALNQRPAYHLLSKRLNDIINRTWQSLFIVDIQNDCDCGIERYKVDSDQRVAYVSSNGCKFSYLSGDIDLPMQRNFSEYNLEVLLKYSFDKSKKRLNMPPDKILYNKNTALNKLNIIKNKQEYKNCKLINDFDFIPVDSIYILPEPEYFGAISVNVDRFGAFCLMDNIRKIELY